MRKVNKPQKTPKSLVDKQNEIEQELSEKKDKFKWIPEHYSDPIKEDLKNLYHNKCGFCEIKLLDASCENQFTVEHYRPKNHYWWLGNEWTNLFPTCWKCNNQKREDFPLYCEKINKKIMVPPFTNGRLDRGKCVAGSKELLAEKPLWIHPEIDDPEKLLYFDRNGKIDIRDDVRDKYDRQKAKHTIVKLLNRPNLEENRKRHFKKYWEDLKKYLNKFIEKYNYTYTTIDLKEHFSQFFENLWVAQSKKSEFSLMGYCMLLDFDKFFLEPIETNFSTGLKEIVEEAFKLFIAEHL